MMCFYCAQWFDPGLMDDKAVCEDCLEEHEDTEEPTPEQVGEE